MPADIVAVLVVPAEGDPGGLLAASRCSASNPAYPPACCTEWGVEGGPAWVTGMRPAADGKPTWALPLWWDGRLVEEGWDRARRVVIGDVEHIAPPASCSFSPSLEGLLAVAESLVRIGLASRVVRLARVDGRLVEVSDG